eukprot:Clim_evm57s203 gene=Clim_evmTU57s203
MSTSVVGSGSAVPSANQSECSDTYPSPPEHKDKFRASLVKDNIQQILKKHLVAVEYTDTAAGEHFAKTIASEVRDMLKNLDLKRYKFIVQATVGDNNGCGVKMAARFLWDPKTDACAEASFVSDTIFATVIAAGLYLY